MYTTAALLDLHERTHRSLQKLLDHCAGFGPEDLDREVPGLATGSILQHLHHVIGAEQYWLGVLRGELLVEEVEADRASVPALRAFRERVAAATIAWLATTSDAELNTPRAVTTWGGKEVTLVPAHAVVRTQTHVFQHQGHVAAMARLLGRPLPRGLDFPLG
jgi:uncharacterized damage-inducible protein DinB